MALCAPKTVDAEVTITIIATTMLGMSLPPDQPPSSAPAKPKLSAEERRARQADRLTMIRLRMAIGRELDDRGITTPAAIGEALGMPAQDVAKLLTRHQWREGDVELLQAAAARLGLPVPGMPGETD
jgi:hypothetical protein